MQQAQIYYKADISFSNAYKQAKKWYFQRIGIRIFEAVSLIALISIDFTLLKWGDRMPAAEGLALASTVVCLIFSICSYCALFLKDFKTGFYSTANDLNHITTQPIMDGDFTIENCTSKIILHNPSQLTVSELDERIINIYTKITLQQLYYYNDTVYSSVSRLIKLDDFISCGVMIAVIVLMATSSQLNALEIVILTIYLILQAYIKLKIMIVLLIMVISPIICIVSCIVLCCCKPQQEGAFQLDIELRPARIEEVVKSDGQCAICLQEIKVGENIYQLKCSQKHIFHDGCLSKWFKVKQNCPTCRRPLPRKNGGSSQHLERQVAQIQ